MKRTALLFLVLFGLATLARGAVPPPHLVLYGPATNITAAVTANLKLVLVVDGEKASATLTTERPLAGTGQLTGTYRGGWCELAGKLDEGFEIRLAGVFDGRDFRGTYLVDVPNGPRQYGRFRLALQTQLAKPPPAVAK
jgi:hypothetical protein